MKRPSLVRRKLSISAVVLLLGAAFIGTARGQAEEEGAACHDKGGTLDIVDCLGKLTMRWDKQLNTAYQIAMKGVDPSATISLRAAERAWLEYRKQRCYYLGAGPGTIGQIIAADCFYKMTRARAEELTDDDKVLSPE